MKYTTSSSEVSILDILGVRSQPLDAIFPLQILSQIVKKRFLLT